MDEADSKTSDRGYANCFTDKGAERPRLSNGLFLAIIERDTLSKARQLARRPAPRVQKDNTAFVGLACHGRSTATKAPNHPLELKIV